MCAYPAAAERRQIPRPEPKEGPAGKEEAMHWEGREDGGNQEMDISFSTNCFQLSIGFHAHRATLSAGYCGTKADACIASQRGYSYTYKIQARGRQGLNILVAQGLSTPATRFSGRQYLAHVALTQQKYKWEFFTP